MVGNLIADFVKGSADKSYDGKIAAGINFLFSTDFSKIDGGTVLVDDPDAGGPTRPHPDVERIGTRDGHSPPELDRRRVTDLEPDLARRKVVDGEAAAERADRSRRQLAGDPAARLRAIHYAEELGFGNEIDPQYRTAEATAEDSHDALLRGRLGGVSPA